jgi:trk system potassium uptake protein
MYIIIVGGGKIGYHLAKALLAEGHELLVIEKKRERTDFICGELGSICLLGDGCETSTLDEAGTGRADMLIAVTGDDEDNLVSCQVAKHKFNVPRTIARSSNPKNEALFTKLGVDVTVSSTNVIMENIEQEVPTHVLNRLMTFRDRGLELVEMKIPTGSKNNGQPIKNIDLPPGCIVALIIRRNQKPQTPTPDTVLQPGDQIIALTPADQETTLKNLLLG